MSEVSTAKRVMKYVRERVDGGMRDGGDVVDVVCMVLGDEENALSTAELDSVIDNAVSVAAFRNLWFI